ncbi:MAG TPA: hypothetical protein DCP28_36555 [Cytophagales bacterium]|nr:hypothetical protein [Cytophagales bacterium]
MVVMAIGFLLYQSGKRKQRYNLTLEHRNRLIEEQKEALAQRDRDVTDSITYARRIQQAILPQEESIHHRISDFFIYYQPRDIVSGDFYWFQEKDGYMYMAAVDCTGHGVPGAFMSMIGYTLLNERLAAMDTPTPGELLAELHRSVQKALRQSEYAENQLDRPLDGMDIALCRYEPAKRELWFAGARRPLWYWDGDSLQQIKGAKRSVGGLLRDHVEYPNHQLTLAPEAVIYLFSDGLADQFGGQIPKKFTSRRLRNLLGEIAPLDLAQQKERLAETLQGWQGSAEQVDDMLMMALKV